MLTPATRLVLAAAIGAAAATNANGAIVTYVAQLNGPSESPPTSSAGYGHAQVDFDITAHTMRVIVDFFDLTGVTTASHIHAATAVPGAGTVGVATQTPTFAGFPLGVTSGTYDHLFDMTLTSSFNAAYITANGGTPASAEIALKAALDQGRAYLNIHTNFVSSGEIRGFLNVPSPGAGSLLAAGPVLAFRRRR